VLTLSGTATTTGLLTLTGTGNTTLTGKAATTGALARTGTGTLTFTAQTGLRGALALTGGSLLELSGVKDAELVDIPFDRTLLSLTVARYLHSLTTARTLGNIWEPPRTLQHVHDGPSLTSVRRAATLTLIT
jgi:hypothetical protein